MSTTSLSKKGEDNLDSNEPSDEVRSKQNTEDFVEISDQLIEATLFRLTQGIPKRELSLMVSECTECEKLLEEDIALLDQALENDSTFTDADKTALQTLVDSPLTPLDRYWTASALLGRMRREMMLPSIHTIPGADQRFFPSQGPASATVLANMSKKNTGTSATSTSTHLEIRSAQELVELTTNDLYTQPQRNSSAQLLALWKKISSNRAAHVFKRPVRPEEAPGYTDRIVFPMDLSLIRKLIVNNKIDTFQKLHEKIGLICHNCVKYNGRETDYGRVARDFEAIADEYIKQAVNNSSITKQPQENNVTPSQNQLADAETKISSSNKEKEAMTTTSAKSS